MKLDWPHVIFFLGTMLLLGALVFVALKMENAALLAVAIPALGALVTAGLALFRGNVQASQITAVTSTTPDEKLTSKQLAFRKRVLQAAATRDETNKPN